MPLTFEDRIRMEIYAYPDFLDTDEERNQLITDAILDVISEMPTSALFSIAEESADSGSGITVGERKVLRAWKTDYVAEKVDYLFATDSQRTFDSTNPVWYELGGTAYILPSGGTFLTTRALTATVSTEEITGANKLFDRLVIYKSALHALRLKLTELRTEVDAEITLPSTPTLPAAPSIAYSDATAATVTATSIGAFGTPPVYTQPTLSESYTNFDTYFDLEDSEIGQLALARIESQLSVFRDEMQDQMNVFQDSNVEYQASIQDAIEQARITLQEARQNAEMATSVAVANEARTLEAAVQDYIQELARHAQEVASYSAQVSATIRKWEVSLNRVSQLIRMIVFDMNRIKAEYDKAFLQYIKSYSQMPRVRVWHHEY